MENKKIVFLTGTRAEYGKMKKLMLSVEESEKHTLYTFVTGMHMLEEYGLTKLEVIKDGYSNIHCIDNSAPKMDLVFSKTIQIFSEYISHINPDAIVVHGDRLEALAGAVVGALNNIKVLHIEGGEVSGTIDESIRHSITKFSHIHLVANEESKKRVVQLGENHNSIYVIGSPDIDVMLSEQLPTIEEAKEKYDFDFSKYALFMYHPVVTELNNLHDNITEVISALDESDHNYIIIYPNNDEGSSIILDKINKMKNKDKIRVYPSISFEHFLTILKNADYMIGNSSAGVRETGVYSIPSIDIGNRQNNRYSLSDFKNIQHVKESKEEILNAIHNVADYKNEVIHFGAGNSAEKFMELISDNDIWDIELQKNFVDMKH